MPNHMSMAVAKTVADVAWTAIETQQRHNHHHNRETPLLMPSPPGKEDLEIESLRSENQRLRNLLQQNLTLFQSMSTEPSLLQNCPLDVLYFAVLPSSLVLSVYLQFWGKADKDVVGFFCSFFFF